MQPKQMLGVEELVKEAELLQVNLRSCSTNCSVPALALEPSQVSLKLDSAFDWVKPTDGLGLFCFFTLKLEGSAKASFAGIEEGREVFSVTASYVALYRIENQKYSTAVVDEFCEKTASFHVHGYMREFIDSTMRRMGVPPFTLPLLKPEKVKEAKGKQDRVLQKGA